MNIRTRLPRFYQVVMCGVLLAGSIARADDEKLFEGLVTTVGPALVSIKYVLKVPGSDRAIDREINAVLIDPAGVVLCSNSQLVGARARMSLTPTDIKILIGDDTEGVEANVVARDSEYDLAWLRIKTPPDHKLPAIDLAKSAPSDVGQRVFLLDKMGRYFDRATVVRTGRIAGTAKKPRSLIVPDTSLFPLGLPVFNEKGELVGMTVSQMPDQEEMNSPRVAMDMRGAGNLILPGATVAKVTRMALESADKDKPDAAAKPGDATPPAPEKKSEKP